MKLPSSELASLASVCLLAGFTAGCAAIDPYQRAGMWRPEGVNDGNIAAMVQDPRDLARGHGDAGPRWNTGEAAVDRLWRDKVKPLPGNQSQTPAGADNSSGSGGAAPSAGDAAPQAGTSPPSGGGS
ncbi:MAG TPA: hypothetical protein VMB34_20310 [Acetobacteraceae bacterium]|nr:hypothetical protein [Acetobacteraceae bacterium]